jgi:SAM-dependent methyltransferase
MSTIATPPSRAKLPPPDVYEQEYRYWPWGEVLRQVTEWVVREAPPHAHVLDYMCGTGFLLNEIRRARPDLMVGGCDIDDRYVTYGNDRYSAAIDAGDALDYRPGAMPQLVLCTAGLHHITPAEQRAFVRKVAGELPPGGTFLIAEEVLSDFTSEAGRRRAVIQLSGELILFALDQGAPEAVIEAATDVMVNDLLLRGEYKQSLFQWRELLSPWFALQEERFVWPAPHATFGDVMIICRRTSDDR